MVQLATPYIPAPLTDPAQLGIKRQYQVELHSTCDCVAESWSMLPTIINTSDESGVHRSGCAMFPQKALRHRHVIRRRHLHADVLRVGYLMLSCGMPQC